MLRRCRFTFKKDVYESWGPSVDLEINVDCMSSPATVTVMRNGVLRQGEADKSQKDLIRETVRMIEVGHLIEDLENDEAASDAVTAQMPSWSFTYEASDHDHKVSGSQIVGGVRSTDDLLPATKRFLAIMDELGALAE